MCGRLFILAALVLAVSTSDLRGDTGREEWAKISGYHLGYVEAAAAGCPGLKLNTARMAKILSAYGPELGELERSRVDSRRKGAASLRGLAATELRKYCDAAFALYGRAGLLVDGYLLRGSDTGDESRFGGSVDRPIAGMRPENAWIMRMVLLAGLAQSIESECQGYSVTPLLEGLISKTAEIVEPKSMAILVVAMMATVAETYELKGNRGHFCSRILADHGPQGQQPLVVRKN